MRSVRLLITGAEGFVGQHVLAASARGELGDVAVLGTRRTPAAGHGHQAITPLDIRDGNAIDRVLSDFRPTHVLHLAGFSSPAGQTMENRELWDVNTHAPIRFAAAIQKHLPNCWFIFAGSGLIYGDTANTGARLDENALLRPSNAYGVTKAAADLALGAMAKDGLKVIRFRPFNHTGPGQSETFVVPGFAAQIARIEAGLQTPQIRVGDLSAERDFVDVRCVVDAYFAAIRKSSSLPSGQIINLASGKSRRIGDILDYFVRAADRKIEIVVDEARLRPADTPRYVGDANLARQILDWEATRPLETTLDDVLDDARVRAGLRG